MNSAAGWSVKRARDRHPNGRDARHGGSVSTRNAGRIEPGPAPAGRAQIYEKLATLDLMLQARKLPASKTPAREASMSAYFVVELEITNQEAMEPYRAAVGATIKQYGGRFLVRAGATELIEGGPEPKRIVILEFADKAAFKRWYDSPEYQKILPGRLDNSTGRAFVVEGVS
jgi:uncharacterized protein (DUF1330 family)